MRYLAHAISIDLAAAEYGDTREGVVEVAVLFDTLLACGAVAATTHEDAMAILRRLIAAPHLRKPRIGAGWAVQPVASFAVEHRVQVDLNLLRGA